MRLRKAARTVVLSAASTLMLSACAGGFGAPPPFPTMQPPTDDTYRPVPEIHPACVETVSYSEEGEASWYGRAKRPRKTASGQIHDINGATAAHRYLPLGSRVKVTNLSNGQTATLTINDRGPYKKGRIIDISQKSARDLGFLQQGVTRVRIETTEPAKSDC